MPMPNIYKIVLLALMVGLLSGCALFRGYQPVFSQGNIITDHQVAQLHKGLTKNQVQVILGTPVATSAFTSNRWDYIYTLNKGPKRLAYRKVVIYFANERVSRINKDLAVA